MAGNSIEDMIDRAIEDYAVSGDAMRWTPDEPELWVTGERQTMIMLDNSHPEPALPPPIRFVYHYWWLLTPPPRGRDFLRITGT